MTLAFLALALLVIFLLVLISFDVNSYGFWATNDIKLAIVEELSFNCDKFYVDWTASLITDSTSLCDSKTYLLGNCNTLMIRSHYW